MTFLRDSTLTAYDVRNTIVGVTEYFGIPLERLRIESVRWTPEISEHITTRTDRYGPNEFNIEPEWATEAAMDPDRIVAPAGANSDSLEVVGFSKSANQLLKIWLYPDSLQDGAWFGASASKANSTDRRNYKEVKENG